MQSPMHADDFNFGLFSSSQVTVSTTTKKNLEVAIRRDNSMFASSIMSPDLTQNI